MEFRGVVGLGQGVGRVGMSEKQNPPLSRTTTMAAPCPGIRGSRSAQFPWEALDLG